MSVKLTEWKLKVSGNGEAYLGKLSGMTDKLSGKFSKVQGALNSANFQNFAGEIPGVSRGLDLMSNSGMLAGASVAALGAAMYKSTTLALDYEKGMAKINATAQLTPPELAKLKEQLKAIGEQSGGNFERIPDAFEKINSQVNNVQKSLEILKVANKGAQAGFVDIDLAAGALAQTLSIVGNKSNAGEVMDTLLKAKAVGAGEFSDFAQYLPQLIAAGSNLNIGFKDTAGLFAFMTAKGQNAADSAMLMQNAFTAMGKSDIQQKMAKAGLKLFNPDGTMRDLDKFFADLSSKLEGMSAEGKSNFLESIGLRDAQAKNAFAVLAGDAKKLNDIMKDVRNSTGELNKQFDMTANHSRTWGELGDQLKSWGVSIGDYLIPVFDTLMQGIEKAASGIKKLFTGEMFQLIQFQENMSAKDYAAKFAAQEKTRQQGGLEQRAQMIGIQQMQDHIKKKYGTTDFDSLTETQKAEAKYFRDLRIDRILGRSKETTASAITPGTANAKTKDGESKIKAGINSINETGRSVRNVTVNIGKLVEGITINPANIKESTQDIMRLIEDALVRAVNGGEEAIANG